MDFTSARIRNFKAIRDTTLSDLQLFNVIVGTNGSGKSSVLQALHWMLQSGRNPKVQANRVPTDGAVVSVVDADYMPSPDYKNSSHSGAYGNFRNAPKMEITLVSQSEDGDVETANLWIKAARNEGISVHIPSVNPITTQIRNRNREISAYIPGLAGIPLSETKLSKRVVHRQAAAGDANTVLRNLLYLLKTDQGDVMHGATQLDDVLHWVSKVLGDFSLRVDFEEEEDFSIQATFLTDEMIGNHQPAKPLELAGIGFLQVIQIFAYLIYYRPQLLLVDEPDSHLHPNRQEELVRVLYDAAREYDCQVIMTTHSPSVVRAMPSDTKLIWMKEGRVEDNPERARAQMGWGLLDKTVLLLSEDKDTDLLRKIISQWPEIDRKVAVWPLNGIRTLPSAESLNGMNAIFGDTLKIAMHRDGDFMTGKERVSWSRPYTDKRIAVWITKGSDIEAYFASAEVLTAFGYAEPEAILGDALGKIDNWENTFREKRNEVNRNSAIYPGGAGTPTNETVIGELCEENPVGKFVGKTTIKKIRAVLQERGLENASSFGKRIPQGREIAPDLRERLNELIG